MAIATFRIRPGPQANFQDLRKTLILLPGIHCAEIQPEALSITFDPQHADLARVEALIRHAGFVPDEPGLRDGA